MNNVNLRESLEELHLELLQLSSDDAIVQEKRDALASYIRDVLAEDSLDNHHTAIKALLNEHLLSFGASYPKVSELLNKVELTISSIGI